MKASAFEFRFRLILMFLMVVLGFWSPWIEWTEWIEWIKPLHPATRSSAWLWLGFEIGGLGLFSSTAIELVTGAAILCAAVGAVLRVWGTAYLGPTVVNNANMLAGPEQTPGKILADGPYRFVRNPLYLGSLFTNAAIAVLMPPSGAAVFLVLLSVFLYRLILAEEAFLTARLGEPYLAYYRSVPRVFPSLRTGVHSSGNKPQWGMAMLAELFPLGILVGFAALSWQYNSELLIQAVIVSFGVSLVARALMPKATAAKPEA